MSQIIAQYVMGVEEGAAQRFWATVADIYREQIKAEVQEGGGDGKVVGIMLQMFIKFKDNLMADGGSPMASTFLQQSKFIF